MESFGIAAKKNRLDRQFHRSSPRLITVEARLDGRREREKVENDFRRKYRPEGGIRFQMRKTYSTTVDTAGKQRSAVYIYRSFSFFFSLSFCRGGRLSRSNVDLITGQTSRESRPGRDFISSGVG